MNKAFHGFLVSALFVFMASSALAMDAFPTAPDAALTPGALCKNPATYRYPENIAYCGRDVDSRQKAQIYMAYDEIGYQTRSMKRQNFKIDHYFPLCMGGSNESANLWPQHKTVYTITDPLEQKICEKMSEGVLLQRDAVDIIKKAKADLSLVDGYMEYLEGL
ncbi:hypothetical protein D3C87_1427710 [compost metagenome]